MKPGNLRQFQEGLAAKLARADQATADALLGIEAGSQRWLLPLSDAGEVVPLPPLAPVPLTRPWYAGLANIRGTLYSVVDLAAFQGEAPTPRQGEACLLLVGARHGMNSALLVGRALGLRTLPSLTPEATPADTARPWAGDHFQDAQGRRWTRLLVPALLADPAFLDVAC